MLPTITYEVHFIHKDSDLYEVYTYPDKTSALFHYRLFYEPESYDLYEKVFIIKYNWKQKAGKIIDLLSFIEEDYSGKKKRKDWRLWNIGRPTICEKHDDKGDNTCTGVIVEKYCDHAIMETKKTRLRIDDSNIYMFR